MIRPGCLLLAIAAPLLGSFAPPPAGTTEIMIDAARDRHPISPLIYGASFADAATIADLGLAANRAGGNGASLYDWRSETRNAGRDWYFESMPIAPDEPAQYGARFVARTLAAGAMPMVTVPMTGWVARTNPDGTKRASFSIARRNRPAKIRAFPMPAMASAAMGGRSPATIRTTPRGPTTSPTSAPGYKASSRAGAVRRGAACPST